GCRFVSGSTTWVISTFGCLRNTGSSCLPRMRQPMTATRTRSFGPFAAPAYVAAESVRADAWRNRRRVTADMRQLRGGNVGGHRLQEMVIWRERPDQTQAGWPQKGAKRHKKEKTDSVLTFR